MECSSHGKPKDLKSVETWRYHIYGMSINHQALLDEDENNYISSYWNFGETKTRDETNSKIYDEDVTNFHNQLSKFWNNKNCRSFID